MDAVNDCELLTLLTVGLAKKPFTLVPVTLVTEPMVYLEPLVMEAELQNTIPQKD